MQRTYAGILRRDRIEWTGEAPEDVPPDRGVRVQVTILDEGAGGSSPAEQGRRMREALEAAARAGGLPGVPDVVQWQHEVRRDRPLPGRDA